jgi:TonB-linked SusC/RagA family outer membrane protein
MTKKYSNLTYLLLVALFLAGGIFNDIKAQSSDITVSGVVKESGSGLPLHQVSVSVAATGISVITDEEGAFTIEVPNLQSELVFNIPDYVRRNIFLLGKESIEVFLVPVEYKSIDVVYNSPIGTMTLKDATFPVTTLAANEMDFTSATSVDQAFHSRIPGMRVIQHSGMPGQRTYMNIRGLSSLYAHSEPLIFIDGMIYDHAYANKSLMEGFALNPLDVVDIDDISDVTVIKDGLSFLGAAGSNGVININTEQREEASTVIQFRSYGGISSTPANQDLLTGPQFRDYFTEMLASQGYDATQIGDMYPWLNGSPGTTDYYRYNNNTDWQSELFSPSAVSKYHFFLKGGDDIATYNLSTGYLMHNGVYDNSYYNRFNLRVNGRVNITNKFTVTPNVKLSMADSKLANHGPSVRKNPILSTLLIPQLMAPNVRDGATGEELNYLDDVGDFNVSNPSAIIQNALGVNRNYHFLSSVSAEYKFTENLSIATLLGINFNNARENIFLPDIGLVQVDSAYNSPGDFIYEFRSTQNHTALNYNRRLSAGHNFNFNGGLRYVVNSYKHNLSLDLNTPSDDFKRLGQGSQYSFLRTTIGDNRGLSWVSYFGNVGYDFRNKYYLSANLSYDGNSATNKNNRYHMYPSAGAAWRVSSEPFMANISWLDDLKLRGSYSETGNMFSGIYDYSKLYYVSRRMNTQGVLLREIIPNENLALERKSTVNAGIDLSLFKQLVNVHLDFYQANVDNLVIQQTLPASFGYTSYFDNGGKLQSSGIELSADTRVQAGDFIWTFGASVNNSKTRITGLNFLDPGTDHIITSVDGAEYITSVNNPVNAFYGYKTDGIVSSEEAGVIIGPKGVHMQAGDIRFFDVDGNNVINDSDKMIIGDPNPDYFGSVFTGFAFRNFQLSAFLNYSFGNDVFNYVRYKAESMDSYNNQSASVLQRWTESNPNTSMPRASFGDPTGNTVFSDRWIEDGSYLRLAQLSLAYKFPSRAGLYKGITAYLTANNLFTFTNYSGYDPEFMYMNNPFYMGIDYGKIPQTQSFVIGLKLDL